MDWLEKGLNNIIKKLQLATFKIEKSLRLSKKNLIKKTMVKIKR